MGFSQTGVASTQILELYDLILLSFLGAPAIYQSASCVPGTVLWVLQASLFLMHD